MSKELPPSRTAEQFVVRFPEGMRDRISEAAKANNRSMNAEIVVRLQQSFETRNDTEWQLRVAIRTNAVCLQTVWHHMELLRANIDRLNHEVGQMAEKAPPDLLAQLKESEAELNQLHARNAELLDEKAALEHAKNEADREMRMLLDRIADSAIQTDLRRLYAAEDRLGVLPQSRMAIVADDDRFPSRQPMMADLSAYEMLLETALAKRDEKIRSWWQKEFGYDPDAPKVERPASKGPVRSPNAKKPRP